MALLFLISGPACQSCPPEAEALLRHPEFHDPVGSGRSFLAALGCDNGVAEYLCLGESLKQRHGATLSAYLIGRKELREEVGGMIQYAFQLDPIGDPEVREDGILVWWGLGKSPYVGFLMEAQHFSDLIHQEDGRRIGSLLQEEPFQYMQVEDGRLFVDIPVSRSTWRGLGRDIENIGGIELRTEWKISDVVLPEGES